MTKSTEPASTPISAGGWKYDHQDEQDRIDFEHFGADELRGLERNGNYDFGDHPAYEPGAERTGTEPAAEVRSDD